MPISKRRLTKWRKEALQLDKSITRYDQHIAGVQAREITKRILLLTQELLDQHLLKEK